jgi:Na+-translocating ferredoxin:NAD+ oxidoreductase RnfG subunit
MTAREKAPVCGFSPRFLLALFAALFLASVAPAQVVFFTVDQAIEELFPEGSVTRTTEVLDQEARKRVAESSGSEAPTSIVHPYVVRKEGEVVGTVYFDVHRVRTRRETMAVAVGPDGRVIRVLVCAFAEPQDYIPPQPFYDQFAGRILDDRVRLRRGVDAVTGATLTCKATVGCVRRVLALHAELNKDAPPSDEPPAPDDPDGQERATSRRRR